MKLKYIKYNIESVIKANLETQSVQRALKDNFGLLKTSYEILTDKRYISNYLIWPEDKKKQFILTIGGKVNFKRTKNFIEERLEGINENR
jgi:hypothetical protein